MAPLSSQGRNVAYPASNLHSIVVVFWLFQEQQWCEAKDVSAFLIASTSCWDETDFTVNVSGGLSIVVRLTMAHDDRKWQFFAAVYLLCIFILCSSLLSLTFSLSLSLSLYSFCKSYDHICCKCIAGEQAWESCTWLYSIIAGTGWPRVSIMWQRWNIQVDLYLCNMEKCQRRSVPWIHFACWLDSERGINNSILRILNCSADVQQSLEFVQETRVLAEMKIWNHWKNSFRGKKIHKHTFFPMEMKMTDVWMQTEGAKTDIYHEF